METAAVLPTNEEYLWQSCLGELENRFTKPIFEMWIRPMRVERLATDEVTLTVQNAFAKDWAENRLKSTIVATLAEIIGSPISVRFVVDESAPAEASGEAPSALATELARAPVAATAASDDFRHTGLNERYTFEQFVVGATNRFAHAAAQAVAEAPARAYNPLFIYGAVGLGKTHLMHAIGHRVCLSDPRARVVYVSSETFTNEFITAIKNNQTVEFRNRYRTVDVLLIDDIQFLEGKEQTQEEFFHTFNTLHEASKQLVISSDRPPKDIQTLENRLRSRFEWGLIADIQPPDLETKIAILQKKAENERVRLADDVAEYIARSIKSNIRELEGALIRLIAFASLTGAEVNLATAQQVLKNIIEIQEKKVTIEQIQKRVGEHFGLRAQDLKIRSNSKVIAFPRQVAMFLVKQLTSASLPEIGRQFGGKHHTTVLHSIHKIETLRRADKDLNKTINRLLDSFG